MPKPAATFNVYTPGTIDNPGGAYVGSTVHVEDAALLVSAQATGSTIRTGRLVLWTEGIDGEAGDSYDHVHEVAQARLEAAEADAHRRAAARVAEALEGLRRR